ncbi:hypothetical protein QR680_009627 [Steinernema hermaphroditum]|uniref:Transcription and mRNA export factor ENY2 n=1 Tax=Steinernema hermaphroditum TaxID=289476 RepID=A0AA39INI2_9BILA|nr:hypothetical protein QR680_009627 [Steinernema hermaphroditum]
MLTLRLSECGWTSLVEEKCRDFIRKKGIENVTLEQVVGEVKQDARKAVPEEVKREIMDAIRAFVSKQVMQKNDTRNGDVHTLEGNLHIRGVTSPFVKSKLAAVPDDFLDEGPSSAEAYNVPSTSYEANGVHDIKFKINGLAKSQCNGHASTTSSSRISKASTKTSRRSTPTEINGVDVGTAVTMTNGSGEALLQESSCYSFQLPMCQHAIPGSSFFMDYQPSCPNIGQMPSSIRAYYPDSNFPNPQVPVFFHHTYPMGRFDPHLPSTDYLSYDGYSIHAPDLYPEHFPSSSYAQIMSFDEPQPSTSQMITPLPIAHTPLRTPTPEEPEVLPVRKTPLADPEDIDDMPLRSEEQNSEKSSASPTPSPQGDRIPTPECVQYSCDNGFSVEPYVEANDVAIGAMQCLEIPPELIQEPYIRYPMEELIGATPATSAAADHYQSHMEEDVTQSTVSLSGRTITQAMIAMGKEHEIIKNYRDKLKERGHLTPMESHLRKIARDMRKSGNSFKNVIGRLEREADFGKKDEDLREHMRGDVLSFANTHSRRFHLS